MFGFAINDWEIKKCTNNKWFGERPQAPILWVFKSLITEDKDPSFNIYLEANKQWIKDQKIANPEFEEKFKQIQKELSDRHGFDIRTGSDYASGMFINKSIKISREKLENTSEAAKLIYDGVSEIFNKEKIDEIFKQIQQIIKPIIPTDNRSTEEDRDHSKSP